MPSGSSAMGKAVLIRLERIFAGDLTPAENVSVAIDSN